MVSMHFTKLVHIFPQINIQVGIKSIKRLYLEPLYQYVVDLCRIDPLSEAFFLNI